MFPLPLHSGEGHPAAPPAPEPPFKATASLPEGHGLEGVFCAPPPVDVIVLKTELSPGSVPPEA